MMMRRQRQAYYTLDEEDLKEKDSDEIYSGVDPMQIMGSQTKIKTTVKKQNFWNMRSTIDESKELP